MVLTYLVLGAMALRLLSAARYSLTRRGRSSANDVVRQIRWRHVWPVPLVLAVVAGAASLLLAVPGLDWGWWTAIGGQGNPVTGTTDRTTGTIWEWLIPLVFLLLVLPALPLFALSEERMFRRGAETWTWKRRDVKVVSFGLIHAIIGIPIGVALALSLGGIYFMWFYLRTVQRTGDPEAATLESAAAHTTYNGFILTIVLVVVILTAAGVT